MHPIFFFHWPQENPAFVRLRYIFMNKFEEEKQNKQTMLLFKIQQSVSPGSWSSWVLLTHNLMQETNNSIYAHFE